MRRPQSLRNQFKLQRAEQRTQKLYTKRHAKRNGMISSSAKKSAADIGQTTVEKHLSGEGRPPANPAQPQANGPPLITSSDDQVTDANSVPDAASSSSNLVTNTSSNSPRQQRRKRSNEPSKRSKEKQRKPTSSNQGDPAIEQRLEQLTKENNALKTRLDEQIRLNSVIVANPAVTNEKCPAVPVESLPSPPEEPAGNMLLRSERSAFSSVIRSSAAGTEEQHPSVAAAFEPHPAPAAPPPLFYPPNFFNHLPPANCSSSQLEFIRLAAQLSPFSLFSPNFAASHQLPPSSSSIEQQQQLLLSQLYRMPSQHLPTLQAPAEASSALLAPLTLDTSQPSLTGTSNKQQQQGKADEANRKGNKSSAGGSSTMRENGSSNKSVIITAKSKNPRVEKDRNGGGDDGPSLRAIMPLQFDQPDSSSTIPKEQQLGNAQTDLPCWPPPPVSQLFGVVPSSRQLHLPSASDTFTTGGSATDAPPPLFVFPERKTVLEMASGGAIPAANPTTGHSFGAGQLPPTTTMSENVAISPLFHHHSFARLLMLQQQQREREQLQQQQRSAAVTAAGMDSELMINGNGNLPGSRFVPALEDQIDVLRPSAELKSTALVASLLCPAQQREREKPVSSSSEESNQKQTEKEDEAEGKKTRKPTLDENSSASAINGGPSPNNNSSSSSSSTINSSNSANASSSMLGTLLAAPSKRRTSPVVPASRSELCSGLASSEVKAAAMAHQNEKEQIEQPTAKDKSQQQLLQEAEIGQEQQEKNTASSDSEQSTGGQHSPNSMDSLLHSTNSMSSPSTLPGAGSTVTTICGSDRTRRSSSPSGNSGCSGDEPFLHHNHHHHHSSLLSKGLSSSKDGSPKPALAHGDKKMHQRSSSTNGQTSNYDQSPPAPGGGSMRHKLRTCEELERYMDRRRRNNEAAKRCRANRRAVFEYRSRRAQLLENENGELRQEMIKLNTELEQLKALIAQQQQTHRLMPNA